MGTKSQRRAAIFSQRVSDVECNLLLDGQLKGRKYFGNTTVHVCVWGGGGEAPWSYGSQWS